MPPVGSRTQAWMHSNSGCLEIQPNKFPGHIFKTKFQEDFYIDRASEVLQHGIQTHALSVMFNIMNKTAQKNGQMTVSRV